MLEHEIQPLFTYLGHLALRVNEPWHAVLYASLISNSVCCVSVSHFATLGRVGREIRTHIFQRVCFIDRDNESQVKWCVHGHRTMENSELKFKNFDFKPNTLSMNLFCTLCRSCFCLWKIQLLPEFFDVGMIKSWILILISHWKHSDCLPYFGQDWASLYFWPAA